MKHKIIALLGHLGLVWFYFYGMDIVEHDKFLVTAIATFCAVGLWAALGDLKSPGFSLSISLLLWLSIGAWIFFRLVNKDNSRPPDIHSRSEGGEFYLIGTYFAVFLIIITSFGLGRFGFFLFSALDKKGREIEPLGEDRPSNPLNP